MYLIITNGITNMYMFSFGTDKVKAIAWFRKIIFDNSSLLLRIEYLELLLKFLKHRKLSGYFAGLPDTRRPLQKFNKRIKVNIICYFIKLNPFILF